jgi:ABC-2 type transport system permease protein
MSALALDFSLALALFRREALRFARERSRWIGVVIQPLLFWAVIGRGLGGATRIPGFESVDYASYFAPGIAVMIVLFAAVFATMATIEDRMTGFLQGVLVAPGRRWGIVAGKGLAVTALATLQVGLFVAAVLAAGVDAGVVRPVALLGATVLTAAMLSSICLATAWSLDSTAAYHAVLSVVMLPLWLTSGAMFSVEGGALGWLERVNPLSPFVHAVRAGFGQVAPAAWEWGLCVAIALGSVAMATLVVGRVPRR